ncbi:MAG: glycosyltransferase [Patescibacteria group bacterium]
MKYDSISVVIPTLNEEGNVGALVKRLDAAFVARRISYELIFIDDHSIDRTRDILRALAIEYPISLFIKQGAKGKAQSLLEGFARARYDVVGMIDADLQYPPEAMPEMIQKIQDGFDVVVVNRVERHVSFLRKLFSKTFALIFVRALHGFNFDVQAGLKVMKRTVVREIEVHPTPWTFDLEFLVRARQAGHQITSVNITFDDRHAGISKVNLFRASFEIGWNALKLKFLRSKPIHILPTDNESMIGAGIAHKQKRFITHTTLAHRISAIQTFMLWQKVGIGIVCAVVGVGFIFYPLSTAIILTAILSAIYFFDFIFNFYLVIKSLSTPPEIVSTEEELANLEPASLPVYSILCPLYREAHILPGFLEAIAKIDWPKEKLDVLLLLEENDRPTIEAARAMGLPSYVRIVVVPHSMPKTKPKACNYGLAFARGGYLVIYDAEDIPDPMQLKKAYLGFGKVSRDVRCLQAKLNYFNPHQNLLTRFFTAEYSLWFDLVLTGLQTLNTSIPLGGTSNHFRTADLIELEGWDPFNVTEDCDLGIRLFKKGYSTAIIDSVTLEEANSNVRNWLRQRSRWIKGYMQTYLVHMRHPVQFAREFGVHALIFQLNVGGKIAFMLINPFLWIATVAYFTLYSIVGPTIEALYPPVIFYMAATSLIFGNFLCIYYYMIGCAKRGHWPVVKYIFLIPLYWLLASLAAFVAAWQLVTRPHYWEKTNHGLHILRAKKVLKPVLRPVLKPAPQYIPAPVMRLQNVAERSWIPQIPALLKNSTVSGGSILIIASVFANFVNFIFNAFLGRVLTFEELGLVTLISTLSQVTGLFLGGFGSTVNYKTAYLSASGGEAIGAAFLKSSVRKGLITAFAISAAWIFAVPFLSDFFQIADRSVLLLFMPTISFGIINSAYRAYLQGNLLFSTVALTTLLEPIAKLLTAGILVALGLNSWIFLAIPISVFAGAVASYIFVVRRFDFETIPKEQEPFPWRYFVGAVFTGFATVMFLNFDIILVKHYLSPQLAGQYIFLALVGKMIYFFGSMPNMFMVTFVRRFEGLGKKTEPVFRVILASTLALVCIGVAGLGVFGRIIVPVLLGDKAFAILPYVTIYAIALALFTILNVIVVYHLARREYIFPVALFCVSIVMAIGIVIFHSSVLAVANVVFMSSIFGLGVFSLMHFYTRQMEFVSRNFIDFIEVFLPKRVPQPASISGKRILIFNWRDTRHVLGGGAEVYIHEIAKHWVTAGNVVTIFCGNDSKSPRSEVIDGIQIIRRGGFYFVYVWAFFYYIFRFRGRYDIVIDGTNGIPFFTPLYVKEPIYCLVHHVHQEVFLRWLPKPLAIFARFLERDLMPIVYRNIKFITVSESSKRDMDGLGLGKRVGIDVVTPGVDLEKLCVGEKSSTPTVLYLGRLKAYKSIDVLIKAFRLVLSKTPTARLVIAGFGEEESKLKRLARELQIDRQVDFKGKVSEDEKLYLLQSAWMLVNPSMMEGWGITTIEANACGTPIIASDVPGLRDSIHNPHTGFLVPYGDWREFAARIEMMIEDHKLREEMNNNAVSWAQNFDWLRRSNIFLSVINE